MYEVPASPSDVHELARSHEEAFYDVLTGVANHEVKLALAATLITQPDRWFSGSPMHHELVSRQGEHPGWVPNDKGAIGYCINSLWPVGLVAKGTVASHRGETTAFKANEDNPLGLEVGLELSGALMDWSLQYPDISLQKVLGITAKKGGFRTPEVRYKILRALVGSSAAEVSYSDIASEIIDDKIDAHDVYSNIRDLAESHILDTKVLDIAQDVVLEIVRPEFVHTGMQLEDLKYESQVIYQCLEQLSKAGKKVITFNDLYEATVAIYPDFDVTNLRHVWHDGLSEKSENMPGLRKVSRAIEDPSKLTTVKLPHAHAEAIIDLVVRLSEIEDSTSASNEYKQRAVAIINSPASMAVLFAKTKRFSAAVAGQERSKEEFEQRMLTVIKNLGEVTVKQASVALKESGQPLTTGAVDMYLRKMASQGVLTVEKKRADPTKLRKINFFSLNTPDSQS